MIVCVYFMAIKLVSLCQPYQTFFLNLLPVLQNFLLFYIITSGMAELSILVTTKTMLQLAHNINVRSSFASEEEIIKHTY